MKNIFFRKPRERRTIDFEFHRTYYILDGNKIFHNLDLRNIYYFDFHILNSSIMVSLYGKHEAL